MLPRHHLEEYYIFLPILTPVATRLQRGFFCLFSRAQRRKNHARPRVQNKKSTAVDFLVHLSQIAHLRGLGHAVHRGHARLQRYPANRVECGQFDKDSLRRTPGSNTPSRYEATLPAWSNREEYFHKEKKRKDACLMVI